MVKIFAELGFVPGTLSLKGSTNKTWKKNVDKEKREVLLLFIEFQFI